MTAQNSVPTLTGPKVTLRAARPDDAAARVTLGNDPEIRHMFGGDPKLTKPISLEQATAWVDAQMKSKTSWVIESEGRMIGGARLHSIDQHDGRGVIAIGILDPDLLGKGLGTEAIRLVCAHAFGALGLHRLTARILDYNARSLAAFGKAGFVEEGRERQAARVAHKRHDDVMMGLLASEFAGLP